MYSENTKYYSNCIYMFLVNKFFNSLIFAYSIQNFKKYLFSHVKLFRGKAAMFFKVWTLKSSFYLSTMFLTLLDWF